MPAFSFTVRDPGGTLRDGVRDGASPAAVADWLLENGDTPIRIEALLKAASVAPGFSWPWARRSRIGHEELLLFSRQLHSLLKAGIPITRALTSLQESASPAMAAVLGRTRLSLESGNALSLSMARQQGVFSSFYISMVQVGELTGRLDEVFLRLFHHLSFERLVRDQVRSALRYPSFVLVAMGLAIEVVNLFVIPAFRKAFESFGAELPLMTRMLIAFSDFCRIGWPYLLGAALAAMFGFRAWTATPAGRLHWDRLRLRLPLAGKILRKAALARFARSFSLALRSGLPVVQAMVVVAATVENEHIAQAIDEMRAGVERGDSVLRAAAASRIFTPIVLQMVSVGEEAGTLEEMLAEVADVYQQDVEYDLKRLSAQIEPILIVFLGVLVLTLALGVFLPIWNLGHAAIKR